MASGLSTIESFVQLSKGKRKVDYDDDGQLRKRAEPVPKATEEPPVGDNDIDLSVLEALERDAKPVEAFDDKTVKRLVLGFERKLRANVEARMKHAEQPERFVESEIDLDEEIKKLSALAAAPELYPELVRLDVIPSILGLLSHENTDIAIDAVNLLHDLSDADVVGEYLEEGEALVGAMLANNCLELLYTNLTRMSEEDPEEANAVYNTLGIIENMVEVRPETAEVVGEKTKMLRWLLNRVKVREASDNKLYAAEILAILLQGSSANQRRMGPLNGVDTLLQAVALYKSRDPGSPGEVESLENLYDALCSALMPPENKEKFVKAEGVELMLIVMKNRKHAFFPAVKVLDFATTMCVSACDRFVDVLGLKTAFAAFMGKMPQPKEDSVLPETEERLLSILANLAGNLSRGSRRERFLAKFVENEFEKIDRLMEFFLRYREKVAAEVRRQEEQMDIEDDELQMNEEEKYLAKLGAGLYTLQLISLIFGHIWASEHPGMRDRVLLLLKQRGFKLGIILEVLKEYAGNIGDIDGEEERDRRRQRVQRLVDKMSV